MGARRRRRCRSPELSLDFWAPMIIVRDGASRRLTPGARRRSHFYPRSSCPALSRQWALGAHRDDDVFYASRQHFQFVPPTSRSTTRHRVSRILRLDDARRSAPSAAALDCRRAFTPKVVARIEAAVRDRAHRLVSSMIANNPDRQADSSANSQVHCRCRLSGDMISKA